jgi:trehalose 6-phosphate synthase
MSRLVVVSNRVAYLEKKNQSGGLAVALGDALRETGGMWFGWDGTVIDEDAPRETNVAQQGKVTIATIPLTQQDYDEYYVGFANQVLWPVCHYRLDLVAFETAYFDGYRRVNARLADALAPLLRPDDAAKDRFFPPHPVPAAGRAAGRAGASMAGQVALRL